MPSHALPKRWLPAIKCFANLTAGQLEEKGLPSDSQAVERKLKYIYCDGDAFVFCRGDFIYPDVVKRPDTAYTSWADALKHGSHKYHQRCQGPKSNSTMPNTPSYTRSTTGQKRPSSSLSTPAIAGHAGTTGTTDCSKRNRTIKAPQCSSPNLNPPVRHSIPPVIPVQASGQRDTTAQRQQPFVPSATLHGHPIPAAEQHSTLGCHRTVLLSNPTHGGAVPAAPVDITPVNGQPGVFAPARVLLQQAPLMPSAHVLELGIVPSMAATAPAGVPQALVTLPNLHGLTLHLPQPPAAHVLPNHRHAHPPQGSDKSYVAPVSTLHDVVVGMPCPPVSGSRRPRAQLAQLQSGPDVQLHSPASFSRIATQQVQQSESRAQVVAPATAAETAVHRSCPAAPIPTEAGQHKPGAAALPILPQTNISGLHLAPTSAVAIRDAEPLCAARQSSTENKSINAAAAPLPAHAGSEVDVRARAKTDEPSKSASGCPSLPVWDSCVALADPVTRRATDQRLEISVGSKLGQGGCGSVLEAKVKLFGANSLSSIKRPNAALKALLASCKCTCRSADAAISSQGTGSVDDSCHCSASMALKLLKAYELLAPDIQSQFAKADYDREVQRECWREYQVMQKCHKSANIIDCFAVGAIQRVGVQQQCLLLELSELGSVELNYNISYKATQGLSDVQTQHIVKQVAAGLSYMHHMAHTLHRDLKWGNLLLFGSMDSPLVKICDFGISKQLADVASYGHTTCCTPEWAAPEQANSSVGQDWRLDSFSLGLLVLALRTGRRPFWWLWRLGVTAEQRAAGRTPATLNYPHCPYNHPGDNHTALGPVEKAFVQRCLTTQISERPAASGLLRLDPYLADSYVGG